MLHEGALQRMQRRRRCARPSTVRICLPSACTANIRQERTGSPSTMHRAGAADAVLAADMRAGLPAILADRVDQACAAARRRMAWSRPLMVRVMSTLLASCAASLVAARRRRADALRRRRHFVDLDAERRQRVVDGVDHRRRRADRAAFAQALGLGDGCVAEAFPCDAARSAGFRARSAADSRRACW